MSEKGTNFLQGTIDEVSKCSDAVLEVIGELPKLDEKSAYCLHLALNELVINCLRNRVPNSEIGAQKVEIVFENDHILVRDDFKYEDESILKDRLELLNKKVKTPGISTTKSEPGGIGVTLATKSLGKIGKKLEYHEEDRGIVAKINTTSNKD